MPVMLLCVEYGQMLVKRFQLLGKSTEAMASLRQLGPDSNTWRFCYDVSPKMDVQAWPLSNATVQEDLL